MSKETISLETLNMIKIISEVLPLCDHIMGILDNCADEHCYTCEYRRFDKNCKAMRIAITLHNKEVVTIKRTLIHFIEYLKDKFYATDISNEEYGKFVIFVNNVLKEYIKEQL